MNFVIECRVVRLSTGRVGSGLGLNYTRPDWVTLLETRLIFDRIFGLGLLFQVVGWVGWSCRLSEFGLKFRLILWIGIDFFFFFKFNFLAFLAQNSGFGRLGFFH